jgi:excisionase family DNA binding protein
MPQKISNQLFYSATETCEKTGISKTTLQRWLQKGVLDQIRRDRRGFRLFTEEDLILLKTENEKVHVEIIRPPNEKIRVNDM